jgi:hypothetical protein
MQRARNSTSCCAGLCCCWFIGRLELSRQKIPCTAQKTAHVAGRSPHNKNHVLNSGHGGETLLFSAENDLFSPHKCSVGNIVLPRKNYERINNTMQHLNEWS